MAGFRIGSPTTTSMRNRNGGAMKKRHSPRSIALGLSFWVWSGRAAHSHGDLPLRPAHPLRYHRIHHRRRCPLRRRLCALKTTRTHLSTWTALARPGIPNARLTASLAALGAAHTSATRLSSARRLSSTRGGTKASTVVRTRAGLRMLPRLTMATCGLRA
jgi:hypothetical protein